MSNLRNIFLGMFGAMAAVVAVAAAPAPDDEPVLQGTGLCRFVLGPLCPEFQNGSGHQCRRQAGPGATSGGVRVSRPSRFPSPHPHLWTLRGLRTVYPGAGAANSVWRLTRESVTNLHGYYFHPTREVITWRQDQADYLGNNILHEVSHAIMFAHYERVPTWLAEGCATYFSYPRNMQDSHDVGSLKYRWARLNLWLRHGKLPALKTFVDLDDTAWHKLDTDLAYAVSWSFFQYLMSTARNKWMLRDFFQELQAERGPQMHCAALLDKRYPGGLKRIEQEWHTWIARAGRRRCSGHISKRS